MDSCWASTGLLWVNKKYKTKVLITWQLKQHKLTGANCEFFIKIIKHNIQNWFYKFYSVLNNFFFLKNVSFGTLLFLPIKEFLSVFMNENDQAWCHFSLAFLNADVKTKTRSYYFYFFRNFSFLSFYKFIVNFYCFVSYL